MNPSSPAQPYSEGSPPSHEFQQLLDSLPKKRGWEAAFQYQYGGFWYTAEPLDAVLAARRSFQAQDTDIILVTPPKSGTTWLKSLAFTIVNRARYSVWDKEHHPLLTTNPHGLVPFYDVMFYGNHKTADISEFTPPRSFATHVDYNMLPESIRTSKCKIIYLCRNPKDVFVSLWLFTDKIKPSSLQSLSLDEAFELFCEGATPGGPLWDQALGYWKWSLENPEKVLFLKYEDLKREIISQVKKISEFLQCPFSQKEESEGVIEQVVKMCSMEHLSNLDVNKNNGERPIPFVDNKDYFRKGEVGDWINYLTPSMAERLDQIVQERLHGSGLSLI